MSACDAVGWRCKLCDKKIKQYDFFWLDTKGKLLCVECFKGQWGKPDMQEHKRTTVSKRKPCSRKDIPGQMNLFGGVK